MDIPHPDLASLIAYQSGELSKPEARPIAAHLDNCDSCRLELHRLRYAAGSGTESKPDRGLLESMRSAIRHWEDSAPPPEEIKQRVAAQIAPFLGAGATTRVLQPVADSGDNLLSGVEPVLALFLGVRAARRLVSHVVDSALIRA